MSKKLEENPQKLEDALKVMEILSSVEGTTAVYDESKLKSSLLPFKDWNADDTYYGDIADEINAGNTALLIYAGWENAMVNTGNRMLDKPRIRQRLKMLWISWIRIRILW